MTRHLSCALSLGMICSSALLLSASPAREPSRDVTFLVTSDAHYDAFENEDRNERVRDTLQAMNAVTNLAWPEALGGDPIAAPRGVFLLGDVIDDGDRVLQGKHQTPRQYRLFEADFGLDGRDGLLNFPVYETWGNHDGPPEGKEKHGFSFQARFKERNRRRQAAGRLTGLSHNALHYSWDWDHVHFVSLGIYPADRQHPQVRYSSEWHDPQGALSFLKEDLVSQVGDSGRPVVLMSHMGFDTDWWHTNDWQALYETVRSYQVVAYFYGHSGTGLRAWAPPGQEQPLPCVNTGQTENGFFVVQIQGDRIRLAYRVKRWREENDAEGRRRRTWDGTWEWRHVQERPLPSGSPQAGWHEMNPGSGPWRWGREGGLQFAVHPAGFRGGQGGPRGLIRLGYPVLKEGRYDLVNFIAVEPIVNGQRGFSELERSPSDGAPGLRIEAESPARIVNPDTGVEQLEVPLRVERFANGAQVRVMISQRSDLPDEICLTVQALPESAPMDYCILTATMGNYARVRRLWLKDRVVDSRDLYPDLRGTGFGAHAAFDASECRLTAEGDLIVAVTTNEEQPAAVRPFPKSGLWHYRGVPLTQYWRKDRGSRQDGLEVVVNARHTYWMSEQPIPGGVSFENFELRQRFDEGQRFWFGMTCRSPLELGWEQVVP